MASAPVQSPLDLRVLLESQAADVTYAVQFGDRVPVVFGSGSIRFEVRVPSEAAWNSLLASDPYRAALSFLRGEFEIDGDITAALALWIRQPRGLTLPYVLRSLLPRIRVERWFQLRATARKNIEFHYDRSNEFFRTFLDPRMVYSCAYFRSEGATLAQAQEAKLDHVCRKLDLGSHESLLDIGCGWGALVLWAAQHYGVQAVGCTLSREQRDWAAQAIDRIGLSSRIRIDLIDYRDEWGRFDKIASVGMVEHVGRSRLRGYFGKLYALLQPSGRLLNHGICRPAGGTEDAATHFLQRKVFPGSELPSLGSMTRAAELAGFEVLDVENLRPHYAHTCRAWVSALQANRDACLALVDATTYRTWLLYLAASAAQFAAGLIEVHQMLLAKRDVPSPRRLTRNYMYEA